MGTFSPAHFIIHATRAADDGYGVYRVHVPGLVDDTPPLSEYLNSPTWVPVASEVSQKLTANGDKDRQYVLSARVVTTSMETIDDVAGGSVKCDWFESKPIREDDTYTYLAATFTTGDADWGQLTDVSTLTVLKYLYDFFDPDELCSELATLQDDISFFMPFYEHVK